MNNSAPKEMVITWNSFSLRILDLILGIIPATFLGSIGLSIGLVGFSAHSIFYIPIILQILTFISIIYVSLALENTKFKSFFIIILTFGLLNFAYVSTLPYQILTPIVWLVPTALISIKHLFMLTKGKGLKITFQVPENLQKYNDLNSFIDEIYSNKKNWLLFQITFGSLPSFFVLIDVYLKFSPEYNAFLQNYDWMKLLQALIGSFIAMILLLFIFVPFVKIQKQEIQQKIEGSFTFLSPFLVLYGLGGALSSSLNIDIRFFVIPILIVLFIRRSKSYSEKLSSEVKP